MKLLSRFWLILLFFYLPMLTADMGRGDEAVEAVSPILLFEQAADAELQTREQQMFSSARQMLSETKYEMLCRLVYCEAADQPYAEQISLAARVLNRVKSDEYPDTLAGVIRQNGAFASVGDGRYDGLNPSQEDIAWNRVCAACRLALLGMDPTDGAT